MHISGKTRVVGIIGDPIAHSLSPAMHNAAFAALGLDYVYVPLHVAAGQAGGAVRAMRALRLAGLNVTVPHKERVVGHLDDLDENARLIAAVNTIYWRRDRLVGENTDVTGFVRGLRDAGGRLRGARALVVGAGGAGRAAVAGLHRGGAVEICVVNRSAGRKRALQRHFAGQEIEVRTADLDRLTNVKALTTIDLIVNATSIGLHGEKFPLLEYSATPPHCLFYDLIYGRRTDFLQQAKRYERPALDGTSMLLHQGAAAFTLWTGRRPPLDVMAGALRAQQRTAH